MISFTPTLRSSPVRPPGAVFVRMQWIMCAIGSERSGGRASTGRFSA
jgi:hypothetical protein